MKERFEGPAGRQRLIEALVTQRLVGANWQLSERLADVVEILEVEKSQVLMEQGAEDDDVYLILSGSFNVIVNGRQVAQRTANDSLGEMAAIQLTQPRSATVVARENGIVARLTSAQLEELGSAHPQIYRCIARDLARRLTQRNHLVTATHEKIRVLVVSSVGALDIARAIQNAFEHDPFDTTIWTDGVFRATNYPLDSLEDQLDQSDFAVAIAHPDDQTVSRGQTWPAPRDNVVFELGLFMGRLGRKRAILMEPRDEAVKLPSDLAGLTTIPYKFRKGAEAPSYMGPACNKLREHILELGPNN